YLSICLIIDELYSRGFLYTAWTNAWSGQYDYLGYTYHPAYRGNYRGAYRRGNNYGGYRGFGGYRGQYRGGYRDNRYYAYYY
ncbi:unnamed protein product, partial [Trichogramma brassicae]